MNSITTSSIDLDGMPHAQKERLAFIDFSLQYFGQVARADLIQRFKTGLAAATRDFSTYRQLAPGNLVLKHQTKNYHRTEAFTPMFQQDPETVLAGLCRGFGDGLSHGIQPSDMCIDAVRLIHPDAEVIAGLMRASKARQPVDCDYVSLSSGSKRRQLVPHSLVNNGHRWHVRAYDRNSGAFRDFVCSRFTRLSVLNESIHTTEGREFDKEWNRIVPLVLIPHPQLAHQQAIELDYRMTDGRLELELRAALVGYLLQQWQVDCSPQASLRGHQFQLAVAEPQALANIENLALAPGFQQ